MKRFPAINLSTRWKWPPILQPQAITLDLLMKPTSGWEILLQLKHDPRTSAIPVIVVTIVDQPTAGAAIGADEYLVKPVDKTVLLAAVARCLDAREVASPAQPILVVEDDTPTREIIAELLKTKGYPSRPPPMAPPRVRK